MLDIGLIFTESLVPRASTKVESHATFMGVQENFPADKVFCNVKHYEIGYNKYLKESQNCFLKADICATQYAGLQIYAGPGSLSHDFKIWPITFQGSGPNIFCCEKISH